MSDNPFEQPGTPPVSLEQRAEQLLARIKPKREYCAANGESMCIDKRWTEDESCISCNRERWASELASILSALQAAEHRQEAEVEKLRAQVALALKARDHYDEERRESYRQMCGWKGLAEKLQAEVESAAHADVARLQQENERLKFDNQELKESFADMTTIASTAESKLAQSQQENAQFRAAMASCSGCDSPSGANSRAEGVSPNEPKEKSDV